MVIIVRKKESQEAALKDSFLHRCTQRLRAKDSEKCVRNVHYRGAIDDSTFEKNYANTLKWAVRHRCKTVAVSCEDQNAFFLTNPISKRFAAEKNIKILLCLPENVTPTSSSIEKLSKLIQKSEKQPQTKHSREYINQLLNSAFDSPCMPKAGEAAEPSFLREENWKENCGKWEENDFAPAPMPMATAPTVQSITQESVERGSIHHKDGKSKPKADYQSLQKFLKHNDAGFKETLIKYICRTGKKDSEIYKKANVDRRLYSKIQNVQGYNPSKPTAIAFAIALELDLEETKDLIGRVGYTLSHASTFDRIIEYFILERNYNIYEINEALFYFDQSLLGC